MKKLKAVLFDLDGTLTPSDALKIEAHKATIAQLKGKALRESDFQALLGESRQMTIDTILRLSGLERVSFAEFSQRQNGYYTRLVANGLSAHPGVFETLRMLKQFQIMRGVVTSSNREAATLTLTKIGILPLVDVLITSDDVGRDERKPHPMPYIKALAHLNTEAHGAVAFEDSTPGVRSATAAGVRTMAIGHELNADHDFSKARSLLTISAYTNPDRLLELMERLLLST